MQSAAWWWKPRQPRPLIVAKAKFLLQLLIVPLDPPAQLGQVDEALQGRVAGQVGEPVFAGCAVFGRPFDQQPEFGPRLLPIVVAMRAASAGP